MSTSQERVAAWRERSAAEGGRHLHVHLDGETNAMLEALRNRFGRKTRKGRVRGLVATAIRLLYEREIEGS